VVKDRVFCVEATGADRAAAIQARRYVAAAPAGGLLGRVAAGGPAYVGVVGEDEPLVAALARGGPPRAAVMQPVRVAGRLAGVLYVDQVGPVEPARARGVGVLAGAAGAALERIVREQKRAAGAPPGAAVSGHDLPAAANGAAR
jgi:hypothetical protein